MGDTGDTSACTTQSTLRPPVDRDIILPVVPSWDSTARTISPILRPMWKEQLLLFWTARTTFPYSRTSFLTDFKTGWIDFSKGPPIGTMSTTGQNFPYLPRPGTANRYPAINPVLFSKFETCNVYY